MYEHKTLRGNFTTYDMRRGSDFIRPSTGSADIMVLSGDTDEERRAASPFWYARIIGIHSLFVVQDDRPDTEHRIDFVRVRWYGCEDEFAFGDEAMWQERIGFIKGTDNVQQFGIIDPNLIIRLVHVIPAFSLGRAHANAQITSLQLSPKKDDEYEAYYVNRSVSSYIINCK